MKSTTLQRALLTIATLALASLVAIGCGVGGGGADKGAGKAANSSALEYLPGDTVFFMTLDTNLDGKGWKNADDLASNFDGYEDARAEAIAELTKKEDGADISWSDVKSWIGEYAGIGMIDVEKETYLGWLEITDKDKAIKFLKKDDAKKSGSEGDFELYKEGSSDDESWFAVSDDLILASDTERQVRSAIKNKGKDSIADNEGVKEASEEIGDDALFALVVSGDGVREAVKASPDYDTYKDLAKVDIYKAFDGASFGVSADDEGFHMSGFASFNKDDLGKTSLGEGFSPSLLKDEPGNTAAVVTGTDLGKQLNEAVTSAGAASEDADESIAQMESLLGIELKDLDDVFSGQWALALGSEVDASGVPPISFVSETQDADAAGTMVEKLMGITQLRSGTTPEEVSVGGDDALQVPLGGMTLTGGVSDDKVVFSTTEDTFTDFGTGDTLGDSETFSDAWDAADVPSEVSFAAYVDSQSLLSLAETLDQEPVAGADAVGPVVAWVSNDDDSMTFDVFAHINS